MDEWANEIIVHSKNIGILVFDDEDAENITEIALIIGRHWLDYSRKKYPNKPNDYLRKKGINLLIKTLYPYLSKESKILMDAIYESN